MARESAKSNEKVRLNRDNLRTTLRIFRFVLPYKWHIAAGTLFLLLSTGTVAAFPSLIGNMVDLATQADSMGMEELRRLGLLLALVLGAQGVFSFFRVYFFAVATEKSMADIRVALYQQIITLPISFFERTRVGEITSRISADVQQMQDAIATTIPNFLRQVALPLICLPLVFMISTRLTLVMILSVPVMMILAVVFGAFIRKLSRRSQDALAEANIVVDETLQSIDSVKSYANEAYESDRYRTAISDVVGFALRAAHFRGAFVTFIIFALLGGLLAVIYLGVTMISSGDLTVGELVKFLIFTMFIGSSVGGIGESYARIQKTVGASERINEILEEEKEIELQDSATKQDVYGKVEFRNLSFSYPSRPDIAVLHQVGFRMEPGSKFAFVGQSGSGKSTIAKLLLGLYPAESGELLIDDKPISSYNLTGLRRNIGIVPQEVILFGGTIRENIAYGKLGASDAEVEAAAEKANALNFIRNFPDGLDTIVGERGLKLSGGQKQRIAIARAILKDPAILILDEATSSLDAESEKEVQEALDKLMENRTTIIIAHRLSTIRNADNILVMSHGRIVESGPHTELSGKADGVYHNLLKLQFQ